MEHYTAHTKYDLVWRRNPRTGEVAQVPRVISGVIVREGEVDLEEDINNQTYGHAGDIFLDAMHTPTNSGVPKDVARKE